MHENTKNVTVNGRTFQVKKFDARTGSFMLFKVSGLLAPLFKGFDLNKLLQVKKPEDIGFNLDIAGMMAQLGGLSEEDFNYVQEKCLQACFEVLPSGLTPVLNANGTFGAIGLEDDTITVLALTAHALMFNLKGFFSGSPLASMLGGLTSTISPKG